MDKQLILKETTEFILSLLRWKINVVSHSTNDGNIGYHKLILVKQYFLSNNDGFKRHAICNLIERIGQYDGDNRNSTSPMLNKSRLLVGITDQLNILGYQRYNLHSTKGYSTLAVHFVEYQLFGTLF